MGVKINRLPVRTWNRLAMNESEMTEEEVKRLENARTEEPIRGRAQAGRVSESAFRFACRDGEDQRREAEWIAEEGSSLTVWMEIVSPADAAALLALSTRIQAGERSNVRLVQVQMLGTGCAFFNDVQIECARGAEVSVLQLFLGSARTFTSLHCALNGRESGVTVDIGYWLRAMQRLDMNVGTLHRAKKTRSELLAQGVLEDRAFKLFRGTIDFKEGAAGSAGEEKEEVLMLGEDVTNQTIPLILCAQEDVQGNHGATIGEPDDSVLFYLESRGLDRAKAVNLLARMKIEGLRTRIGRKELEEEVDAYMEEARGHAEG